MTTLNLAGPEAYRGDEGFRPNLVERVRSWTQNLGRVLGFTPFYNEDHLMLLSEHFGHAEKRNDLNPDFVDPRG